ncbi:DNA polymerase III subunit alpha [Micrococcales bacterium 31B]|nr:DNA polymerase III subunit alpha [Micrococcales bacterium 31B]
MLDGAARIGELVDEVARLGQPAVAITDHGYVFGAHEFVKAAQAKGVKPIVGIEAYVTPGTHRTDRTRVFFGDQNSATWNRRDDVSAGGTYTHMTLWAENNEGMRNLFTMNSRASLDGVYAKYPRFDRELLGTYAKGLIATTGCPSGEIQTYLRLGMYEKARAAAGEFRDIFGRENYFLELMEHGLEIEQRVRGDLLRLAKDLSLPLVATNDLHYVKHEHARVQEALLCINSGSTLQDPDRFKFDSDDYYVMSAEQMRRTWKDLPEACDNTLFIAERCNVSFERDESLLPQFPIPEEFVTTDVFADKVRMGLEAKYGGTAPEDAVATLQRETAYFWHEVERGLRRRYPGGIPEKVQRQAEYEGAMIGQMGFPSYFLVVADFINWAREAGVRVGPGRGSAAGSMAAYAMGITDLDPLEHGLIFERFLNPERISMPDVDIDFDDRRRGEVIEYVRRKYGEDKVAQIVTYGNIKAKQALKDSARVQGFPFGLGEKLTKAMPPPVMGKDIPLQGIFNAEHPRYHEASEVRDAITADPDAKQVYDLAVGLENLKRQWGVHAAGVIMSSKPLIDHIPIMRRESDGAIITQFDYPTCEGLGLLKMDFLGLRNLTIMEDALTNIVANGKEPVHLEGLTLDDPKAYELLSRGDTNGVFQLDGGGMKELLRRLRPDNFEDISAVLALYRPGPMGVGSHTNFALRKNGLQNIDPIHPEVEKPLEEILKSTYGLIVYQEQVQFAAQILANYSLGEADILRRIMGKKKASELEKAFIRFEQGCKENGYSDAAIKAVWDVLVPFAGYAFNKAHTAAYGLVSYWTAYLKANYPVEYMAALLTSVKDDKSSTGKLPGYLAECRHMGIKVLPPDVNESGMNFSPVGDVQIRFGLSAIRNVGTAVVESIIATREEKGKYSSFLDYLDKVPLAACNKRTIESLIKGGAFDSLEVSRRALVLKHEEAVDAVVDIKRNEQNGQFDLFAAFGDMDSGTPAGGASSMVTIPDVPEWDKREKLQFEREMLGLYVSDHPLSGLEAVITQHSTHSISQLADAETVPDGAMVKIAGMISNLQRKLSKNGNAWAATTIEDLDGGVEVAFFSQTYQLVSPLLAEDLFVSVRGRLRRRDDGTASITAQEMSIPDVVSREDRPVTITMPAQRCTPDLVGQLSGVLKSYPGNTEVRLKLLQPGKATIMRLPSLRVEADSGLFGELKGLLGQRCLD